MKLYEQKVEGERSKLFWFPCGKSLETLLVRSLLFGVHCSIQTRTVAGRKWGKGKSTREVVWFVDTAALTVSLTNVVSVSRCCECYVSQVFLRVSISSSIEGRSVEVCCALLIV
eukprot:5808661-Amphidinium_carterae.1